MIDDRPSGNVLAVGAVVIGGMLAAVALVYTVLTSSGNSLAELTKYVAAGAFVAGFVNPRTMLFAFVLTTAYLDLLKRLLILYEMPTLMDLFYVLGVAPMMLAGIALGTLVGGLWGRIHIDRRHLLLLAISGGFILITTAFAFRDKGAGEAVKSIADGAAYSVLLFVVPVLCPDWRRLWSLIRFALIVYLPVGAYTFYQHFNGLSPFEIEYLESGLTIMVKELDDIRPRPFSTLNSAHALAFVSAMLAVFSLIPTILGPTETVAGRHQVRYAMLALFYLSVSILAMARSGHIVWIVALAAIFTFISKKRTLAFYGVGATVYASLIVFAEWFIVKLPVWDGKLVKSTPLMWQATRIQTYTDRLRGYLELRDPNNYTLFGTSHEVFSHDSMTGALFNYGAVPLALMLVIAVVCLVKLHQWVLRLPAGPERRLACLLFGAGLGVVAGAVLFGGVAGVFPVNAFMWISFGGLVSLIYRRIESRHLMERQARQAHLEALHGRAPIFKPEKA